MNGLLAQIFSTIDSKKRQLGGLLSDPLETIYQGVRNFGADQNGLLDTQASAYPWTGNTPTAAPSQLARQALADQGAAQGMAAATVWHGSPHKFDKFDSSKIGTGEGAQAYGHGLYLAESPDVAGGYAKNLSTKQTFIDGKPIDLSMGDDRFAAAMSIAAQGYGKYTDGITNAIKQGIIEKPYGEKLLRDALEFKISKIEQKSAGSLYKVDLPDEHIARMLDWDKPISAQPQAFAMSEALQKARAEKIASDKWKVVFDDRIGFAAQREGAGLIPLGVATEAEAIAKLPSVAAKAGAPIDEGNWIAKYTGKELINSMNSFYGPDKAAEILRQQGIPGIRYLDGGSRGAGNGTSNFVVFPGNEGLLSILERNGQPIK